MRPYDPESLHIYDTTLRDGTQQEGLSLSVADKLAVARHLDDLGVGFIEGGWPGSNPKDAEFFRRARTELDLRNAKLTAFGSTRRASRPRPTTRRSPRCATRARPWSAWWPESDRHVERALRTTPAENLAMIRDTVHHLRAEGKRVFVDAEHFFDGYRADHAYAIEVVRAATEAGAEVVVLCDTNGGMLPSRSATSSAGLDATGARLGIHCQTTRAARWPTAWSPSMPGSRMSRARRTDMASGVATRPVQRRRQSGDEARQPVLPPGRLRELVRVSHAINEITNSTPDTHRPYVGASAFAHKGGLHASAVKVDPDMYQHIDPALVGNDMRMLVSELAGRATIELKGRELGLDLSDEKEALGRIVELVKDREAAVSSSRQLRRASSCCCVTRSTGRSATSRWTAGGSSSNSARMAGSSARPP